MCDDEVPQGMIAYLDGGEDIHLKNYMIPICIGFLHDEIIDGYLPSIQK